jgi:hypothetical protein
VRREITHKPLNCIGGPGSTRTDVECIGDFPKCDNSGSIKPQREFPAAVSPIVIPATNDKKKSPSSFGESDGPMTELWCEESAHPSGCRLSPRKPKVVPDAAHRGMWRVRWPDGRLSDMTNLTRAKDAVAFHGDRRASPARAHSPSDGRLCVKTDSWGKGTAAY